MQKIFGIIVILLSLVTESCSYSIPDNKKIVGKPTFYEMNFNIPDVVNSPGVKGVEQKEEKKPVATDKPDLHLVCDCHLEQKW